MSFGGYDLGDRWWISWCPWFWTHRSSEVVSFGCYGLGVFNTRFHMQITRVTTQGLFGDFSMEVFFNGARKIARFPGNQKSVSTILRDFRYGLRIHSWVNFHHAWWIPAKWTGASPTGEGVAGGQDSGADPGFSLGRGSKSKWRPLLGYAAPVGPA